MAHVKRRAGLRQVAVREYLPWAAAALTWTIIAMKAGPADAARLLAAWAFVRAARQLTGTGTLPSLRNRQGAPPAIFAAALRLTIGIEAIALLAAVLTIALLAWLLAAVGQAQTAMLTAVLAASLPPRYALPLVSRRDVTQWLRPAAGVAGAALVFSAALLDGDVAVLAAAFAAREWIGFLAATILARAAHPKRATEAALELPELVSRSLRRASRRLSYRLGKGILSLVLGPAGGLAARTGRRLRLHRKLDRFTPGPAVIAMLCGATLAASLGLILFLPTPGFLVIAGSLLMVAAVSANVLVWTALSRHAPGQAVDDDESDDDEDE